MLARCNGFAGVFDTGLLQSPYPHSPRAPLKLLGVAVYELSAGLGVHDLLAAVQAEVAREHVGYAAGKRKIQQLARAEKLDREDDRRDRAIDCAAEHRD